MATVTIEDLTKEEVKKQTKDVGVRDQAKMQISQASLYIPILAIAAITQYAQVDLAHLLGAYLIVRGLPALAINLVTRTK